MADRDRPTTRKVGLMRMRVAVPVVLVVALFAAVVVVVRFTREGPRGSDTCISGRDRVAVTVTIADEGVTRVELLRAGRPPLDVAPDWLAGGPSISPDGTEIVVHRARQMKYDGSGPGRSELWAMSLDGSRPRPLTHGGYAVDPDWSPDGRSIVFRERDALGKGFLSIIDARGPVTQPHRHLMTFPTLYGSTAAYSPTWSPDGRRIAYVQGGRVMTMSANGAHRQVVTRIDGAAAVAWRPDGRALTVSRVAPGTVHRTVWAVDARTGDRTLLGTGSAAHWSADGARLYYLDSRFQQVRVRRGDDADAVDQAIRPSPGADPRSRAFRFDAGFDVAGC